MNKLKSSEGKKCSSATDTLTIKSDISLEENIEKLTIKTKNVNGLVNGVNHTTPSKKDKRNKAKTTRNISDGVLSTKPSDTSVKTVPVKALEVQAVADSIPSTSDLSEAKSEKSSSTELKGVKSKNKAKRTDSEKSIPSTSGKSDSRSRLDDSDSSDFDISQYIKFKYGDRKDEDIEKDKLLEQVVEQPTVENTETIEDVPKVENPDIRYIQYESERQMPMIMKIIQKDLSEPYSIYTYRYFIHNWPNLCYLAMCDDECVGAIVCKLDVHRKLIKRGYIAMLAVDKRFRKHGIGSTLVKRAIEEMIKGNADEVVLETEITNKPALRLYEALGFVRDKRLFRYYLNGVDALRLKLWLR